MPDEAPQTTIVSVLLVLACLACLGLGLVVQSNSMRRTGTKNSANLRGIAQSMTIYANSNNDYLPGFNSSGALLAASQMPMPTAGQSGASIHARMNILLHEQYIGADLLMSPQDTMQKWVSGQACVSANNSYAGLAIGGASNATQTTGHDGRAAEWKNNANSQAVLMGDRLLDAQRNADTHVQSVWTTTPGDWKGNLVWGDVHAEFAQTHLGFQTRYLATTTTNDNLFATTSAPGVTESTSHSGANAMLVYY